MGDVVSFPILVDSDLGRELIVDLARFRENLLDEKAIRKKYRLANDVWEKLADDDDLIRAVEAESTRRIRDGSAKREKAQKLVVAAPDVLSEILLAKDANPRHRIDSAKVLNDFCNGPGDTAPASDRFIINIVLNADGSGSEPATLHFNKRITPLEPGEVDPDDINDTGMIAAITTKKEDGGSGNAI
jgi:hypothetical protein